MFDIGFSEIVVVVVIGLVILGPERLPHAIRATLKFVNTAKGMVNNVKTEFADELGIDAIKSELSDSKEKIKEGIDPEISSVLTDLKTDFQNLQENYGGKPSSNLDVNERTSSESNKILAQTEIK